MNLKIPIEGSLVFLRGAVTRRQGRIVLPAEIETPANATIRLVLVSSQITGAVSLSVQTGLIHPDDDVSSPVLKPDLIVDRSVPQQQRDPFDLTFTGGALPLVAAGAILFVEVVSYGGTRRVEVEADVELLAAYLSIDVPVGGGGGDFDPSGTAAGIMAAHLAADEHEIYALTDGSRGDFDEVGAAAAALGLANAHSDAGVATHEGADSHGAYHNDARALAWLGGRSTSDLPEGSNQYYLDIRADVRAAMQVAAHAGLSDPHSPYALLAGRSGFVTWGDVPHRIAGVNRFRHLNSMASARQTAAQTALGVGVWHTLTLTTEDYDTDALHDLSTNPSRILIRTAGKYLCIGSLSANCLGVTDANFAAVHVIKNGGASPAYATQGSPPVVFKPAAVVTLSGAELITLAAGDYLEVQGIVLGVSGTWESYPAFCFLQAIYLGE